jgi:hypothetical protein
MLFMKMLTEYLDDIMTAKQKGKKLCLGTFVTAKHLFFAFDNVVPAWAEPMTVFGTLALRKGTAEYMDYCCEVGFTETSCSAQRGSFGAYLAGLTEKPDFPYAAHPAFATPMPMRSSSSPPTWISPCSSSTSPPSSRKGGPATTTEKTSRP